MKYDDVEWHYGSTPPGSGNDRMRMAGAHIAVYLRWCMLRGWASSLLLETEQSAAQVRKVCSGSMKATDFLFGSCDNVFADLWLNAEGNTYTRLYYHSTYTNDLAPFIKGKFLEVPEEAYDFSGIRQVLDGRYDEWVRTGRPAKKKRWWKFWR